MATTMLSLLQMKNERYKKKKNNLQHVPKLLLLHTSISYSTSTVDSREYFNSNVLKYTYLFCVHELVTSLCKKLELK